MEIIYFIAIFGSVVFAYKTNQRYFRLIEITNDLKLKVRSLEANLDALRAGVAAKKETPTPKPAAELQKADVIDEDKAVFIPTPIATIPVVSESKPPPTIAMPIRSFSFEVEPNLKMPANNISTLLAKIQNYFMSGNTFVKVGVVLIFFGISFLLKYAIDNNIIPIELRLIASVVLGLVLIKTGWNLRQKSRDYALVIQGGGIGVLFLTTFVAMKMYALISSEAAFGFLILYTAATAFLAVKQDSMNLAAFGLSGGFLAPILVSTGQGQHVVLFSYYALLNLAIVYLSWKKAWRELNLLGFVFTFAVSSLWGVLKYQSEFYTTTQPFLIFFFLIYIFIPLMFADKKEPELRGYVDGTLVFGNSIITLLLQLQLVDKIEYGPAFSAIALAAFYIFLSRYLMKHKKQNYRTLAEAFISIGVVFTTIAIPLAFDGLKTSAVWALEAAGIYWVAVKQQRVLARYFSIFLIFITSISFFLGPSRGNSELIFLNTFFFSCVFMAVGSYIISYLSDKNRSILPESEYLVSKIILLMGTAWWLLGGLIEIDRHIFQWYLPQSGAVANSVIPINYLLSVQIAYLSIGAYIIYSAVQKTVWDNGRYLAHSFVFILIFLFTRTWLKQSHPFSDFGFIAWGIAFSVYYYILAGNDKYFKSAKGTLLKFGHGGALWILVGVLVSESRWLAETYIPESVAWQDAALGIVPMLTIWIITQKKNLFPWPLVHNYLIYMRWGLIPIVTISWFWLMITNWTNGGNAAPLAYIPFINPLELSQLGILFVSTVWASRLMDGAWYSKPAESKNMGIVLGGTYFIWLNGILCRAIHQYMGIPFRFEPLFASVEVQVGLSIFWSVLGIAIMIYGSKKLYRWLWITGACLLGVVVAKMFLIDLSKTETIGRVASFIIVGILFLIVGYFSPIPPKKATL